MPIGRGYKRTYRKPMYRKKGYAKAYKRFGKSNWPASGRRLAFGHQLHYVKTGVDKGFIGGSDITDSYGVVVFRLEDCYHETCYTAVFSEYSIRKVVVRFIPSGYAVNSGLGATARAPGICSTIDYDNDTAFSAMGQVYSDATLKVTGMRDDHTRVLVPRVAQEAFRTGVSSGYTIAKPKTWIRVEDTTIAHYGLKWAVQMSSVGTNGKWHIICTYYIAFRGNK